MHAPPPLPKSSLISSYQQQKHWPKISVAYVTKWFRPIFTVGGWRMYRPFNFRLLAPAYKPTKSCKSTSFWSLNPARARNHKPKSGSSPTFAFEARFRPESQPRELRYAQLRGKKSVCRCSCRYTLYHTQNYNHLDQNIGIIWYKHSMLVNDNTAECGI